MILFSSTYISLPRSPTTESCRTYAIQIRYASHCITTTESFPTLTTGSNSKKQLPPRLNSLLKEVYTALTHIGRRDGIMSSSSPSAAAEQVEVLRQAYVEFCCITSVFALYAYENIITLDDATQAVWRRKLTGATSLYIALQLVTSCIVTTYLSALFVTSCSYSCEQYQRLCVKHTPCLC